MCGSNRPVKRGASTGTQWRPATEALCAGFVCSMCFGREAHLARPFPLPLSPFYAPPPHPARSTRASMLERFIPWWRTSAAFLRATPPPSTRRSPPSRPPERPPPH